ncbi:DNA polymerase beta superfamily protein [Thiorhodococcus minor]|uniref:DNA polymerase beta superfamily protein n=1 Tax=Thiorhodococcus minor TaxID=57489 RepID=UPI0031585190
MRSSARFISPCSPSITTSTWPGATHREILTRARVRLQKYLDGLRPLLATRWIEPGRSPAPTRFATLMEALIRDPDLHAAIDDLLRIKRSARNSEYGPPLPRIAAFIRRVLTRLGAMRPPQPLPFQGAALDRLTLETGVRHARSTTEGIRDETHAPCQGASSGSGCIKGSSLRDSPRRARGRQIPATTEPTSCRPFPTSTRRS